MSTPNHFATAQRALARAIAQTGDEDPRADDLLAAVAAIAKGQRELLGLAGLCPCEQSRRATEGA